MIPTISGDRILIALGAFLAAVLPTETEIVTGQENRVPEPASDNFVTMWAISRTQLATTIHLWGTADDTDHIGRSTAFDLQLDVHGPNSEDNAQVITTLLRDAWGVSFFRPYGMEPLYASDGHQMPFVNGQGQYEQRWTLAATLQALPLVSVPQQYADTVTVDLELANPALGPRIDFRDPANSGYVVPLAM